MLCAASDSTALPKGANSSLTDEQFVFGGADDVVEKLEEKIVSKVYSELSIQ